jgi:hypothetical protein
MLELPVAATLRDLIPAIVFDQLDYIPNFHANHAILGRL